MPDLKPENKRKGSAQRTPPVEATAPQTKVEAVSIESVTSSLAVVKERRHHKMATDISNISRQLIEMNYYLRCIAENRAPKDDEIKTLLK